MHANITSDKINVHSFNIIKAIIMATYLLNVYWEIVQFS